MPKPFAGANVVGLFPMLRAISKAEGPEGNRRLREVARGLASEIRDEAVARADTKQAQMVADKAVRVASDRVPGLRLGGNSRVSRSTPGKGRNPKVGDVWFGADFGSASFRQFPSVVKGGRYVYPAIADLGGEIRDRYLDAVDEMFSW